VVGPNRQAPGLPRALLRTVVYQMWYLLPSFLLMAIMPLADMRTALAQQHFLISDWLWLPLFLLLFVTMRRRNGYAAVHDLLSRTRVIVRPRTQARPKLVELAPAPANLNSASAPPVIATASGLGKLGPYEIRTSLWHRGAEELLLAFDPALRRQVWIHRRALNAAPLSPARRDLSRAARLRWLAGGRTEAHLWDAYDTVEGQPLLHSTVTPAPWSAVRFWLLDLGEELDLAVKHPDTAPSLALDRVWIANSGHAVLLDFPCLGLPADAVAQPASTLGGVPAMQQFLDRVAQAALGERPGTTFKATPAPLHARSFLASLAKGAFEKSEFIIGNLHSLVAKPAQVTRAWRAASLTLAPAMMLGLGILIAGMVSFERIRSERAWNAAYPDKPSLRTVAELYQSALDGLSETNTFARDAELTRAFLVHHFGDIITNDAAWTRSGLRGEISETTRSLLKQAVTAHLPPKPAGLEEAARVLPERIEQAERETRLVPIWILLGSGIVVGLLFAFFEFVGTVVFRQSLLLRLFGLALADRTGQPATRLRLCWRWLLTWGLIGTAGFLAAGSVALVVAADFSPAGERENILAFATPLAWILGLTFTSLVLAATIYAVTHPSRSLQDRLAGTWLVPR